MADEGDKDGAKSQTVCSFIKKSGRNRNTRKRKVGNSDSEEDDTVVVKKEKKVLANPLRQSTSAGLKLPKTEDEIEDEAVDKKEEEKPVTMTFKSSRSAMRSGPQDAGATAEYQLDTSFANDAQAIFERSLQVTKELKEKEEDDKKYRGLSNYGNFFEKKDTAQGNAASGMVRQGPIRAPVNIRSTTRWDYQPDICKDYKETGFCGFGDSCKFLHDRGDYKHGWQLEREFKEGRYNKEDIHKYEIDSDEEDDVPFACFICRERFKNPVMTKCQHYFCEKCALDQYRKTQRCFVCGQQTHGVFNPAKDVIKKMKEAEEKAADSD